MDKLKNSFWLGIILGLVISIILLSILDVIIYLIYQINGKRIIEVDVAFALSIIVNLFLARKYFKKDEKQELGKGFLFSSFIGGAAFVYLFYISPVKSIFF